MSGDACEGMILMLVLELFYNKHGKYKGDAHLNKQLSEVNEESLKLQKKITKINK